MRRAPFRLCSASQDDLAAELMVCTTGTRAARTGIDITPLAAHSLLDVLEGPLPSGTDQPLSPTGEASSTMRTRGSEVPPGNALWHQASTRQE